MPYNFRLKVGLKQSKKLQLRFPKKSSFFAVAIRAVSFLIEGWEY